AANDSEQHRAEILQVWRSELLNKTDEAAASPPSSPEIRPASSIARAENADPQPTGAITRPTSAAAVAGLPYLGPALVSGHIAQPEPAHAAHEAALPTAPNLMSLALAAQVCSAAIRAWSRTDIGLAGSPPYACRLL